METLYVFCSDSLSLSLSLSPLLSLHYISHSLSPYLLLLLPFSGASKGEKGSVGRHDSASSKASKDKGRKDKENGSSAVNRDGLLDNDNESEGGYIGAMKSRAEGGTVIMFDAAK